MAHEFRSITMSSLFPHFPVFLDLIGRSVVLLGGDPAQAALARQFLAAGASVTAFDLAPSDALRALAPPLRLKARRWRAPDLAGARLVVAGAGEGRLTHARAAAHAAGASFHALDALESSDIAIGGLAARGALAVGVSAHGAPAAFSDAVRAKLEAALPKVLGDCLDAAARIRSEAERRLSDPDARTRFWAALANAAFAPEPPASAADWDDSARALLAAFSSEHDKLEHSTGWPGSD